MKRYLFKIEYFDGKEIDLLLELEGDPKINDILEKMTNYNSIVSADNKLVNLTNDKVRTITYIDSIYIGGRVDGEYSIKK